MVKEGTARVKNLKLIIELLIATQGELWKNEKSCGNLSQEVSVSIDFRVLSN